MVTVTLLNISKGTTFDKTFYDVVECRKFLIKLQYSKKLTCLSYSCSTMSEHDYLGHIQIG